MSILSGIISVKICILLKTFITIFCTYKKIIAFYFKFAYTERDLGGMDVNDFEKDVQSKNNDVVDSIKGFGFSFIFFFVIFFIGTIFTIFAN